MILELLSVLRIIFKKQFEKENNSQSKTICSKNRKKNK